MVGGRGGHSPAMARAARRLAGLLVARVTSWGGVGGEVLRLLSELPPRTRHRCCPPPSYFIPSPAGPAHKLASKGGAAAQGLGCRAEHALAEVLERTGSLSAGTRTHVEEGFLGDRA